MTDLWLSLGLIFLAEMGDKTQLVALGLATRYKASTVVAGIALATAVVHLLSVVMGELIGGLIPLFYIKLLAGASFLGFAWWTWRGDDDDGELKDRGLGPLMTTALVFFLAELGDKTQLATIALATRYEFWATWVGSTLGMVLADGLAIVVGVVLGRRIPEHKVKMGAVAVFVLFGVLTLIEAFFPIY